MCVRPRQRFHMLQLGARLRHGRAVAGAAQAPLSALLRSPLLRSSRSLCASSQSPPTPPPVVAPSLLDDAWQPPDAPQLSERSPLAWSRIYMELAKSRLSGLVVATTAAGHLMHSAPLDPTTLVAALGGTFLCSASANSFNQLIEVRNDAAMVRTAKRPLPSGRISRTHAAVWASASGLSGVALLAAGTNCVTATLGAATLGLYTLAYTPMKQRTPLNTWVGAVVGAIPPVMGWTAAGGRCARARGGRTRRVRADGVAGLGGNGAGRGWVAAAGCSRAARPRRAARPCVRVCVRAPPSALARCSLTVDGRRSSLVARRSSLAA